MIERAHGAPDLRAPTFADIIASLRAGVRDFAAAPHLGLFFSGFYVAVGAAIAAVTYVTGTTFWLILAVLGFPLIGAFAALGLYEVSRRRQVGEALDFGAIVSVVWSERSGQLPWLAVMVVVLFLFWFFLGHMIFALFLGLSPMTNISSSPDVLLSSDGLAMLAFGTAVGAAFAALTFAMSVLSMPMLLDRDVDFVTALTHSIRAVAQAPVIYLGWGLFIAAVTLAAMLPVFLGLFLALPVLGHATWHLYCAVTHNQAPARF